MYFLAVDIANLIIQGVTDLDGFIVMYQLWRLETQHKIYTKCALIFLLIFDIKTVYAM